MFQSWNTFKYNYSPYCGILLYRLDALYCSSYDISFSLLKECSQLNLIIIIAPLAKQFFVWLVLAKKFILKCSDGLSPS